MPINLAIIGTNWITHDYVSHAQSTGKFKLVAVYSRKADTAKEFASRYNDDKIAIYTSLDELAASKDVDTVYIASPNSLHYEQTKQILDAGKNVILEKPSVCRLSQLDELFKLAYEKKLILIEAYRHVHEVNFKILKSAISEKLGGTWGATFNFCQFSSRYDAVLRGETPNVFSLEFGAGALTDLGCYVVAAAVELFGEPQKSTYFPTKIATGADGGGTIVLQYEGFNVTLIFSKQYYSSAPSEIYGKNGTLVVPTITDIESVTFIEPRKKHAKTELGKQKEDLNLKEEAEEHGRIINEKDVEAVKRWEKHSRSVLKITEGVRKANGLLFPGDK